MIVAPYVIRTEFEMQTTDYTQPPLSSIFNFSMGRRSHSSVLLTDSSKGNKEERWTRTERDMIVAQYF